MLCRDFQLAWSKEHAEPGQYAFRVDGTDQDLFLSLPSLGPQRQRRGTIKSILQMHACSMRSGDPVMPLWAILGYEAVLKEDGNVEGSQSFQRDSAHRSHLGPQARLCTGELQ